MTKGEFNPLLTDAVLAAIEAEQNDPQVTALVAELRLMRAVYCEDYAQFLIADDDPEEWERWVYRSGKPDWFKLPEWFLEQNPWMRQP